jgi:hypothetical protein
MIVTEMGLVIVANDGSLSVLTSSIQPIFSASKHHHQNNIYRVLPPNEPFTSLETQVIDGYFVRAFKFISLRSHFMSIDTLLQKLQTEPQSIAFSDTMATIDAAYNFSETAFNNGDTHNEAGHNNGSCKLFAFAQLHHLSQSSTLALFGDYYRQDVLLHPEATDHGNIRSFIQHGWEGIKFHAAALTRK